MEETRFSRFINGIKHVRALAQDVLFPRRCAGCGREGSVWCAACRAAFPAFLPTVTERPTPNVGGHVGLFPYAEPAVRAVVTGWKYHGDPGYRAVLEEWIGERVSAVLLPGVFDAAVAVPLHEKRLRSRGFNQADVVAERLSSLLGIPCQTPLVRAVHTAPQAQIAHEKRHVGALRGTFICPAPVSGRILLCDDVFTTGATLDAAAEALRAAGAQEVWAFTVATG